MDESRNDEQFQHPSIKFGCDVDYNPQQSKNWSPPLSLPNQSNGKTVTYIAAGTVAAMALTYTPPANASISSILNSLVGKFEDMFGPLLTKVFGAFAEIINGAQADGSAAIVQSVATSTEALINANKEIANNKISLASMPPPSHCESDDIGMAMRTVSSSARATSDNILANSSKLYFPSDLPYATRVSNIASRYSDNEHIAISKNVSHDKLEDSQVKAMIDGVDVMTASKMEQIKLDPSLANSASPAKQKAYLVQSSRAARLEIAKAPFYEAIGERVKASNGESKMSLMQKEVDRTYGGEGTWRKEIQQYADPTPLLSELNKQQSFTNFLLLEQLKKQQQANLLIATQNIDNL